MSVYYCSGIPPPNLRCISLWKMRSVIFPSIPINQVEAYVISQYFRRFVVPLSEQVVVVYTASREIKVVGSPQPWLFILKSIRAFLKVHDRLYFRMHLAHLVCSRTHPRMRQLIGAIERTSKRYHGMQPRVRSSFSPRRSGGAEEQPSTIEDYNK
jgi:hypothetical protein